MGFGEAFSYATAEEIFTEYAALTQNTLCDCSAMSYRRLKEKGPLQWPCSKKKPAGTKRLYEEGKFPTATGRARFIAVEHARAGRNRRIEIIP